MELLLEHTKEGLILALLLSMPAVLLAAGVGLIIGILQAVTQVQEQTIAAAPKIILVFALLILFGGLMMSMLENYFYEAVAIAFQEVPQREPLVLSRAPLSPSQARARAFFSEQIKPGNSGKAKAFFESGATGQPAPNSQIQQTPRIPSRKRPTPAPSPSEQLYLQRKAREQQQ